MKFDIGDQVVICSSPRKSILIPWELGMDSHCGASGEVVSLDWVENCPIYAIRSKDKNGNEKTWWFQEDWINFDNGYYWTNSVNRNQFQELGLKELERQESALKSKRDSLLKKVFSGE